MKQLTFDLIGQFYAGGSGHPQQVMQELGIKYEHATPQSMGDCWWFWNCSNLPDKLPSYITIVDRDPMKCIGFGLTAEKAQELASSIFKSIDR